jgi:hypothetical protein
MEETMFSTWDRNPAAPSRWIRGATQPRRHADAMGEFLASIDVMIYVVGAALAACFVTILL